jgi:large subunit ribosomal protein L24
MKEYSTQPRKQRLAGYNKSYHERNRSMAAHLSDELLKEYSRVRSVTVRKGDTVKVVRGAFKGQVAKVVKSFPGKGMISIEEATLTKADGKKVARMFRPSKVVITKLDLSDPWRREKLNRFKAPGRAERREEELEERKAGREEEKLEKETSAGEKEAAGKHEGEAAEEEQKKEAAPTKEEKKEAAAETAPEHKESHKPEHKDSQKPEHKEAHEKEPEHAVKAAAWARSKESHSREESK